MILQSFLFSFSYSFRILYCFVPILDPPECRNHEVLTDPNRHCSYGESWRSDDSLKKGWYRFQSSLYTRMVDSCIPRRTCSTARPGWLQGSLPSLQDGIVRERCALMDLISAVTREFRFAWENAWKGFMCMSCFSRPANRLATAQKSEPTNSLANFPTTSGCYSFVPFGGPPDCRNHNAKRRRLTLLLWRRLEIRRLPQEGLVPIDHEKQN